MKDKKETQNKCRHMLYTQLQLFKNELSILSTLYLEPEMDTLKTRWTSIPVLPLRPPIVLDDTCFDFKLHVEYKIVSCRALKPYLTSIILEKHHKFWVRMSDLYILMYSYPL